MSTFWALDGVGKGRFLETLPAQVPFALLAPISNAIDFVITPYAL